MRLFKQLKRSKTLQKGQSLVELSITLVFLLMILMGVLDLARVYFIFITIEDAAGEAALYLSLNPACKSDIGGVCAGTKNAEWRAQNASGNRLAFDWWTSSDPTPPTNAAVDYNARLTTSPTTPGGAGNVVTVEITYYFQMLTPLVPNITGVNPLPLTASATQTIVRD